MFRIKPRAAGQIRSIEQEIRQSRARYEKYLEESGINYSAMRSNVTIKDPHSMAGNAYKDLRDQINPINEIAQKANKEVTFEDARSLLRYDEFASVVAENELASKILITVKDKSTGATQNAFVDRLKEPEFMKKILNTLTEMFK